MLIGEEVVLRPVRQRDLDAFITAHADLSNRGESFPLGVHPEPVLRRQYADTGFWQREEGTLLIWNCDDVMVGHIEFFKSVNYWDAYELSYQLYSSEYGGRGYTTEATRLLVDYLFGAKKVNRLSLVIGRGRSQSEEGASEGGGQHGRSTVARVRLWRDRQGADAAGRLPRDEWTGVLGGFARSGTGGCGGRLRDLHAGAGDWGHRHLRLGRSDRRRDRDPGRDRDRRLHPAASAGPAAVRHTSTRRTAPPELS